MFWAENITLCFHLKITIFTAVNHRCILHRCFIVLSTYSHPRCESSVKETMHNYFCLLGWREIGVLQTGVVVSVQRLEASISLVRPGIEHESDVYLCRRLRGKIDWAAHTDPYTSGREAPQIPITFIGTWAYQKCFSSKSEFYIQGRNHYKQNALSNTMHSDDCVSKFFSLVNSLLS